MLLSTLSFLLYISYTFFPIYMCISILSRIIFHVKVCGSRNSGWCESKNMIFMWKIFVAINKPQLSFQLEGNAILQAKIDSICRDVTTPNFSLAVFFLKFSNP